MKLNLGAGNRERIPGYTNVDIVPGPNVDVVTSIEDLSMFKDESVDVIYSAHTLEHILREKTIAVLREWCRVLKWGGTFRIAVPDFRALAELYLQLSSPSTEMSTERTRPAVDRFNNPMSYALSKVIGPIIGGQKGTYDFHQTLFDFETLRLHLIAAGFRNVRKYDWRETEHYFVDDYSQSYFPGMSHIVNGKLVSRSSDVNGVLLSLNVEATK